MKHIENITNPSLTKKQITLSILIGLLFWACGAAISYVGSLLGAGANSVGILIYLLVGVPSGFLTIIIMQFLTKVRDDQILSSLAIGLAAALLLDSTLILFYPALYSATHEGSFFAGPFILWGVFNLYFAYFVMMYVRHKRK